MNFYKINQNAVNLKIIKVSKNFKVSKNCHGRFTSNYQSFFQAWENVIATIYTHLFTDLSSMLVQHTAG